jgi:DNA-binding NarL/FixJ family response regulator
MEIKLTKKERQIIEYKRQGLTVKQIAKKLIASKAYTEIVIHRLYEKTGTTNGANLIDWAYRTGEINREIISQEERKVG